MYQTSFESPQTRRVERSDKELERSDREWGGQFVEDLFVHNFNLKYRRGGDQRINFNIIYDMG